MHTFDSLARSLVRPTEPVRARRIIRRRGSTLAWIVPLCCALMPLGIMVQSYIVTI